jgi:hypothetical protein
MTSIMERMKVERFGYTLGGINFSPFELKGEENVK